MRGFNLLPRKFSSRLIGMTLISGLIPILIFALLMDVFGHRFHEKTNQAIHKGQEEQWQQSEEILKRMAEGLIRQKAQDVALQLDLYIEAHPGKTVQDLQKDPRFREIAVQPIGTGYTAVQDTATAINRFHINPRIENLGLFHLSETLPDFWAIMKASLDGRHAQGYYEWKEASEEIRDKYMYIAPLAEKTADGVQFGVAATTYIDEFTRPIMAAQDVSEGTTRFLMLSVNELIQSFSAGGFVFMALGLVLVLAMASGSGIYFSRALTQLRGATRAVNRGNFDIRVKPVMSGDVGELIEDFNEMVARLSVTTVRKEQLERSEEKLRAMNSKLREEISERERAETELRESEVRYRTLFETVDNSIFMIKKDVFVDCNPRTLEIFACTREQILKRTPYDFSPRLQPDGRNSREKGREKIRLALEGTRQFFEWRHARYDGTPFDTEVSLSRLEVSGELYVLAMVKDITERKRGEEALRESEALFRSVVENSHDGILIVAEDYPIVYGNDELCRMLGRSREEIIGRDFREFLDEGSRELVASRYRQRQKGEEVPRSYEFNIVRKDGERRRVMIASSVIKDSGGGTKTVAQILDVTEQRRAEEDKEKMASRLQRAQKMEAIGTLAGGVAHDLNNILAGLVSYPELLLMEIPQGSPLRKPVLTIQKAGERAAAIVQDLLTLARRGVAAMEVVELNAIVSAFLNSPEHRNMAQYHSHVTVEGHLETTLLNILGSPVHLSKTVMNLLSNAYESMPDGGKITITTKNRYIDRPIRGYDHVAEGDYAVLCVADQGIGISGDDMERIFEPFYTKKVMGRSGTGLGMAVVWGTVKDHHGYIDVESTEGIGSTFTLYFPVTRRPRAFKESPLTVEAYRGKGETLLVVDDVEEQRGIAVGILEKLGYRVRAVSSGEEAVDFMKDHTVDLLVLDMIMDPGMDGLETYKRILEDHPGQRAIIASGFSETGRVREAQRYGAGAYVKKPYLMEKIGLAVRRELDRQKGRPPMEKTED
jgi:PAS domain S-box-containing protein